MFASKGIYSNWDRLGNISAAVNHLQRIKKQVTRSMRATYQGSTHTVCKTDGLVWRIAGKARQLRLQEYVPNRDGQAPAKAVPDLRATGREKFASSSLATFNKKMHEMIAGKAASLEDDEMPSVDLNMDSNDNETYDDEDQLED